MKPTDQGIARVMAATGKQPRSCSCGACDRQCKSVPGLATPAQILDLINAGYGNSIVASDWMVGMISGHDTHPIPMYQLRFTIDQGCSMLVSGLCNLHNTGLKPIECTLSHHSHLPKANIRKSISYCVSREWLRPDNRDTIVEIEDLLVIPNQQRIYQTVEATA